MSVDWRASARRLLCSGLPVPDVFLPAIRAAYRGGVAAVEAFSLVRKVLWIEPVLRAVCGHVGQRLRAERLPFIRGQGALCIGDDVYLSGRSSFYFMTGVSDAPRIEIGDRTFVGHGCTFSSAQSIRVGTGCLISALVRIHDNDGHPVDARRRLAGERIGPADTAPVVIEDNVWIGAGTAVLKGVRIGRDAVVGTGSVVTRDVPAGAVVAGNPARVVRSDIA